nr:transposase (putative), gypsy type [Tanacetum cinerariifolium]
MSIIRDIKSKLNQKAFDVLCTKYHIHACVHPSLPGPDKNILQSPDGKIGVYTRFFNFSNYWIPLSQFLVDVLDHFHIHLSQLSVFEAAKVSHFEIFCRVHGFQPSVNCLRTFYTSSYTKGWMSFVKRSNAAPVCHRKPLYSVKNWNDHFFWVDSIAFPLSVSLKSKILTKDPPPKLSRYDTEACDFLRTHTSPFRKFPEPFLCWVGISRYYTLDENCYPTFWDEMDLFAFIRHSDPTKEHSVERVDDVLEETIAKDASEVVAEKTKKKQKRKVVGDASGSTYPPKKLRDDYQSLLPNTSGKSLAALRGMVPEGSAILSDVTEPLIATFVAPVSDVGPLDFVSRPNLRTCPPHVRSPVADAPIVTVAVTTTIVADIAAFPGSKTRDASKDLENITDFASAGGVNVDAASISKLNKSSTSADSFYASQSLDTKTMHRIYVPKWKVANDSIFEDSYVYLGADVRMRAEHTLERKSELEDKCVAQTVLLSERDTDISHLKSLLSLKESEAIRLRGERDVMSKIATLESANVAKEVEFASLSSKVSKLTSDLSDLQLSRDKLYSQMASLESERDSLISQNSSLESAFELFSARMEATQDEHAKVLGTAIGCAVNKGIQDGLRAGIDHGKAGRDLSIVEAYDPSTKAKYIKAINALGAVDFSLLSEPEDNVVLGETSLSFPLQVVHSRVQRSLTGEASTSAALVTVEPVTTLSTTFASSDVVPPLLTSDDQASGVEPHDEEPPIYTRKAASEAGLPKPCETCSFPSVFLTADVGWLTRVCSLLLMVSILENAVVFAIPRMAPT